MKGNVLWNKDFFNEGKCFMEYGLFNEENRL